MNAVNLWTISRTLIDMGEFLRLPRGDWSQGFVVCPRLYKRSECSSADSVCHAPLQHPLVDSRALQPTMILQRCQGGCTTLSFLHRSTVSTESGIHPFLLVQLNWTTCDGRCMILEAPDSRKSLPRTRPPCWLEGHPLERSWMLNHPLDVFQDYTSALRHNEWLTR